MIDNEPNMLHGWCWHEEQGQPLRANCCVWAHQRVLHNAQRSGHQLLASTYISPVNGLSKRAGQGLCAGGNG